MGGKDDCKGRLEAATISGKSVGRVEKSVAYSNHVKCCVHNAFPPCECEVLLTRLSIGARGTPRLNMSQVWLKEKHINSTQTGGEREGAIPTNTDMKSL